MNDQEKQQWLDENELAYNEFKRLAYKVARTGRRFGFKAVVEKLRWESYFSHDSKYKWSNSVTTYAGKQFLKQYPQFRKQVTVRGEK